MDALQAFVVEVKRLGIAEGHFLGFLHLLIGRRITKAGGQIISSGLTWRELAPLLKKVRWKKDAVRDLGLNPDDLPPRDREKFWYMAIARAEVDSEQARENADALAKLLGEHNYQVGPAPS
ncbi:MAG: hypothetical protein ACFCD0_03175 [Gemmataceae bacterium]